MKQSFQRYTSNVDDTLWKNCSGICLLLFHWFPCVRIRDIPDIQFLMCNYKITVLQPSFSTKLLLRCENYLMVGVLLLNLESMARKIPLCLAKNRDALKCQQGQIYDRIHCSCIIVAVVGKLACCSSYAKNKQLTVSSAL